MPLPEHVHALPLTTTIQGQGRTFTPAAVETERGLLLFDVGLSGTLDLLEAELEAAGEVSLIPTASSSPTRAATTAERSPNSARRSTRSLPHTTPPPASSTAGRTPARVPTYPPARVDCAFDGSVTFDTLAGPATVFPTPGHTPDHVSVHFPEAQFLRAGDALTADDSGLQSPDEGFTEDWDRALESAAELAALDVDSTLCFHGGFVEAGSDRIAEIAETGE